MIFTLEELVHWLGLTVFEIWMNLISLSVFVVLLALKLDDFYFTGNSGWWTVFSPLYVVDGLNAYFCSIIYIRMHMEGMAKVGILRALWSLTSLFLLFIFKYLLCKKLTGQSALEYSEVLSPVFILLQLIAVRACQLHWRREITGNVPAITVHPLDMFVEYGIYNIWPSLAQEATSSITEQGQSVDSVEKYWQEFTTRERAAIVNVFANEFNVRLIFNNWFTNNSQIKQRVL